MYHYVRDLKNSPYPEIKGLDVNLFNEQLRYILNYYTVIRMEDLIDAVINKKNIPNNSLLLTFDDAYKDHFDFVFPILQELNIQGSFFPPARAVQEHTVLDVNKIHFVLASVPAKEPIISDIFSMMNGYRKEFSLPSNESYHQKLEEEECRYDTKEVVFIKRMLQKELPEKLRNIIVDFLFHKYVTSDERSFSRELYLNHDQLKAMKRRGMYIGSHGFDHYWLNTLPKDRQEREVEKSLAFLKIIGCDTKNFVFCYPYGAFNDSLLSILSEKGCSLGLTTQVGIADLQKNHSLVLPRLDTNDLPKNRSAPPHQWTLQMISPNL